MSRKEPNCQENEMAHLTVDMSGAESGKGICQERNLFVRKMRWLTLDMSGERSQGRVQYISGQKPNSQGKKGWLTLDMSGEESGKGIFLPGKWDDSP